MSIATGEAHQGDYRPGSTVTMWLQGYYSVDSTDTGLLSLRISDQTGTITTTQPMTVAKGGDFVLLSSTFVVPQSSVEVCRTAILEVGPVTVAEPTVLSLHDFGLVGGLLQPFFHRLTAASWPLSCRVDSVSVPSSPNT